MQERQCAGSGGSVGSRGVGSSSVGAVVWERWYVGSSGVWGAEVRRMVVWGAVLCGSSSVRAVVCRERRCRSGGVGAEVQGLVVWEQRCG